MKTLLGNSMYAGSKFQDTPLYPSDPNDAHQQDPQRLHQLSPRVIHGLKSQLRLFGKNEGIMLKHEIKDAWLDEHWKSFCAGNSVRHAQEIIKNKFEHVQDSKAKAYLENKLAQSPVIDLYENAAIFSRKGTTLKEDLIRTKNNNVFRMLSTMTPEIKAKIRNQEGIEYSRGIYLGKGATAKAKIAEKIAPGEARIVAVKIVNDAIDDQNMRRGKYENSMFKKLNSRRSFNQNVPILHSHGIAEDLRNKVSYLFMDIAVHGDCRLVTKKIRSVKDPAKRERLQCTLARQCIESVKEMHDKKLYHHDLKPANIFVSQHGKALLGDFGNSSNDNNVSSGGTVGYQPPELGDPSSTKLDADKFSLGVTLGEIADDNLISRFVRKNLSHKTTNQNTPKTLHEVGKLLQSYKPSERPSLEEILNLDYFKKMDRDQSDKELKEFLNASA